MPNHVTTGLTIKHDDPNKIEELKKKVIVKGEDGERFDFDKLIPMPESLHITSGSSTDLGMACYDDKKFESYRQYPWFAERYPNVKTKEDLEKEVAKDKINKDALREGKQAIENKKLYGYKDWYDWSIHNWGTKWNSYEFRIIDDAEDKLSVQFDTAWSPPTPIFEKLQDMGYEVGAVSIDEDSGVDPYYFGDDCDFYVNRNLDFWG